MGKPLPNTIGVTRNRHGQPIVASNGEPQKTYSDTAAIKAALAGLHDRAQGDLYAAEAAFYDAVNQGENSAMLARMEKSVWLARGTLSGVQQARRAVQH